MCTSSKGLGKNSKNLITSQSRSKGPRLGKNSRNFMISQSRDVNKHGDGHNEL